MRTPTLVVLIFLSVVVPVFPQTTKAKSKPTSTPAATKKTAPTPKYLTGPFDDTTANLPPKFLGNSIEAVYEKHSVTPKGEFETSAQFAARKAAVPAATYAFKVEDVQPRYDADEGAFTFDVRFAPLFRYLVRRSDVPGSPALTIRDVEVGRREYVASNALGATTKVESVRKTEYVIASENHHGDGHKMEITVAVPPEEAARLKARLALLVICETTPDLAVVRDADGGTGTFRAEATFDSPVEIITSYRALRANVKGFWVYDTETGKVLERFNAFGKSEKIKLLPM